MKAGGCFCEKLCVSYYRRCSSRKPAWHWVPKIPGVKQRALGGAPVSGKPRYSWRRSCQHKQLLAARRSCPQACLIQIFMWKTTLVSPRVSPATRNLMTFSSFISRTSRALASVPNFPFCSHAHQEQFLLEAPKMLLSLLFHTSFEELLKT